MIWESRNRGSGVSTLGTAIPHEAPAPRQDAPYTLGANSGQQRPGQGWAHPATQPVGPTRRHSSGRPIKTADS